MIRRAGRILATFAGVAVLLVGVTYLDFGTELSGETGLLQLLAVVGVAGALVAGWWLDGRRRVAAVAVGVGLLAFLFGVYGGAVGCNAMAYPPSADHGVEYDWETNALRFGDNLDGANYRCRGTPNRGAVVLGYALASVGAVGLGGRSGSRDR